MPREEASTFQFILCSIWKPGDSNFWVKICLALEESIFQVEPYPCFDSSRKPITGQSRDHQKTCANNSTSLETYGKLLTGWKFLYTEDLVQTVLIQDFPKLSSRHVESTRCLGQIDHLFYGRQQYINTITNQFGWHWIKGTTLFGRSLYQRNDIFITKWCELMK